MFDGLRIVSAYGDRRWVGPPSVGKRGFGVPPGGPFDRLSAALANALLGNEPGQAVVEITLGPATFEAIESLTLSVVGGPDGAFRLEPGERIEIRPVGARAYVACGATGATRRLADPPRFGTDPVRVLRGPQADRFDFDQFVGQIYRVGLASNRVGVRLQGEPMPHALSLPSEPAVPGVVQLPPSGQPIVLGPDGPTIGGYPKIAVVIDADLDRLARAKPGDSITFQEVDLETARRARQAAQNMLDLRIAELRLSL